MGIVAALGMCGVWRSTFVPPPARRSMAAAGAVATLGAAPAFADSIDDAAKKLSDAAYPFLKAGVLAHHKAIGSVDGKGVTSAADFEAINAALGHMIASVPTSKTMDVYNAFSAIVPKDVPSYLMGTVKADDAQKAYSALMEFKDVVKSAR